ncbi:hypothetical protein AN964_05455 [Heyndrickxia shackletonii]|uniref:Uncharacterized protein n=1 Tax=Heyndrickxia shackletonii TaxID=157838 RepID=A0A0Q3WWL7_9BACI|nr:hypothetical protein [Heyndrickxia shackletonii]KQL53011.1 hypothetical protein AN964_05455 [Heyndrickxia shackletonii]NEY98562.1 hypothetical protein [Heyndrickxia shackletonii]
MSHTFNSKNDRPWLKESHKKRSNRSVDIGKGAIDSLIKKGKLITYTNVAIASKEIDPEGKGIHPNTIRTNEQLYDYYKQHSLTYKQNQNSKNIKPTLNTDIDIDFRNIKPNRNEKNTKRNYMKLSKKELVDRLFYAEQYIVEENSEWVASHFEKFK